MTYVPEFMIILSYTPELSAVGIFPMQTLGS